MWTIQAAIAPRGGEHGEGGGAYERRLIDRAFASDDKAHAIAWEASCRSG